MPHKDGWFDGEKVIVIDLDNSSNLHLSVDFARYYGMDLNRVIENVLVSRQFKNYQLINAMHYELPKRVQIHKPRVIVISGLVDQFLQEPNIDIDEFESLRIQIVTALHKIKDVLIILASRFGDNKIQFPALSRIIEIRAKKELHETKLNLSIYNNGRLKRISMMEVDITNWQILRSSLIRWIQDNEYYDFRNWPKCAAYAKSDIFNYTAEARR